MGRPRSRGSTHRPLGPASSAGHPKSGSKRIGAFQPIPDAATAFADRSQNTFASWGLEGSPEPHRYHQGPGQVDLLWILDVNGAIVILDAMYGPATPADLVDELRTLAESATFEAP